MSEACRETTWRQLSWIADWHVREECYSQALAGLIDMQHRQHLAAHWVDPAFRDIVLSKKADIVSALARFRRSSRAHEQDQQPRERVQQI